MERKTKIIATLGPSSSDPETLRRMVEAGMDVARLNFSHGDHETHRRLAGWVREAAQAAGRPVALLQDVQGPKIRTGTFPGGAVSLAAGAEVELVTGEIPGDERVLPIDYPFLRQDVQPGEQVLLADGLVRLEVIGRTERGLLGRVRHGGVLGDHKGVAFPQSRLRVPVITEKDQADLAFGRELEVDYVAASFVRSAGDLGEVARRAQPETPLIAKIELAAGYENLDEILGAAHGAMVARGDLGVELPLEKIPLVQIDILTRSNERGRVSITATEMLESMTVATRPTRAEVTDVASAVLSGTDAVMLSGETAVGRNPVRVVEVMDIICREVEQSLAVSTPGTVSPEEPFPGATSKAAVEAANALGIRTIVAFSESGSTALLLSKHRPRARIVAFTPDPRTWRRMALYWGVRPFLFDRLGQTDEMFDFASRELVRLGLCEPGEAVVMVAGVPPNSRHSTNLMKLHEV